jgi:hypothetical protein
MTAISAMNSPNHVESRRSSMLNKMSTIFIYSVSFILAATALAKFTSAFGNAKLLDLDDSLLQIPNRLVLHFAALLESIVVWLMLLGRDQKRKLVLVVWISSLFAAYRTGNYLLGQTQLCPCLGSLTEFIPLSPTTVDRTLLATLAYMLGGSLIFLIINYVLERKS